MFHLQHCIQIRMYIYIQLLPRESSKNNIYFDSQSRNERSQEKNLSAMNRSIHIGYQCTINFLFSKSSFMNLYQECKEKKKRNKSCVWWSHVLFKFRPCRSQGGLFSLLFLSKPEEESLLSSWFSGPISTFGHDELACSLPHPILSVNSTSLASWGHISWTSLLLFSPLGANSSAGRSRSKPLSRAFDWSREQMLRKFTLLTWEEWLVSEVEALLQFLVLV